MLPFVRFARIGAGTCLCGTPGWYKHGQRSLTLRGACCYGARSDARNITPVSSPAVGILGLGYFFYKFRNSITLEGFRWSHGRRIAAPRESSAAAAVDCDRSTSASRFGRCAGCDFRGRSVKRDFWNVYRATLMGFTCTFLLGRAGEPIRPGADRAKGFAFDSAHVRRVRARTRVRHGRGDRAGGFGACCFSERRTGGTGRTADHEGRALGGRGAAGGPGGDHRVPDLFPVPRRQAGSSRKLQHENWRTGWREKVAVLLEGFSDGLQGIRTWERSGGAASAYSAVHWVGVIIRLLLGGPCLRRRTAER